MIGLTNKKIQDPAVLLGHTASFSGNLDLKTTVRTDDYQTGLGIMA
jgi:hypothetical protein